VSGAMISRVMAGYERGEPAITRALHGMKDVADRMGPALSAGDPARVGQLLSENWDHQCRLDPGMRTDDMARLEAAMKGGVLGGKAAGAGAGGCMFFLAEKDPAAVAQAARSVGATVLPMRWAGEGVRVW
jgi:galactokinase/mevalonate kinase-like predicted kinase